MATKKPKPTPDYLKPREDNSNWDAFFKSSAYAGAQAAPKPSGFMRRALGDTGIALLKGAIGVPEAAVGLADLVTGGGAGRMAEAAGFRPKEAKAALDEYLSPEQQAANAEVQRAEGFLVKLGAALQSPSVIGQAVAESLPSIGAGGVAARGMLAIAPRLSPVVAGAAGEGIVGAGAGAEQIRQETPDGMLTGTQAALAAGSGALTGALGVLGGKVAQRLGIGDVDTMLAQATRATGTQAVAAEKVTKGLVRRVLEGVVSEGVLEELPQSIQEQVAQNAALGKPLDDGVDYAAVLGLLSGGLMGGGAAALSKPGLAPNLSPGDDIRAKGLQPEVGPMTRALNVAVEAGAQKADAGAPVPPEPGTAPATGEMAPTDPKATGSAAEGAAPPIDFERALARIEAQGAADVAAMRDFSAEGKRTAAPAADLPPPTVIGPEPTPRQAPDILTASGKPFKSQKAAQTVRVRQADPGAFDVVAVEGGWAVRPIIGFAQEDMTDAQPDLDAVAPLPAGPADGSSADAGRSGGTVGLVPAEPGQAVRGAEPSGPGSGPAVAVEPGSGADKALTPDAAAPVSTQAPAEAGATVAAAPASESDQDRSSREWRENYQAVVSAEDLGTFTEGKIRQAINYAAKQASNLGPKAWAGDEEAKKLITAFHREEELMKFHLKTREKPAAPTPGGFDSAAWDKAREERIKASRDAGNTHLDKVPAYVETMRGKAIYYVHDPKVKGTIRTVDNNGNVYVNWADAYSAEKEGASPMQDGKKTVMQTSLGPRDLKDYALAKADPAEASVPAATGSVTTQAPELVKTRTRFGMTTYVRKADLDGDKPMLRMFTKDGKNNGRILRENLDPTGEKQAADNAEDATNPLFDTITAKNGRVFKSRPVAVRERTMRGLQDTYDIVESGPGFVLKRKNAAAPPAPNAAAPAAGQPADADGRATTGTVPSFDNAAGRFNPDLDPHWIKAGRNEIGDSAAGSLSDAEYNTAVAEYANAWRVESLLEQLGWKRRGSSNVSSSRYYRKVFEDDDNYAAFEVRVSDHDDRHPTGDGDFEKRYQVNFRESEDWDFDERITPSTSTEEALKRLRSLLPSESPAATTQAASSSEEKAPVTRSAGPEAAAPSVSANTVFTEDAANAARERLRKKLGRLSSGIDPETMMDGITLAGYHIEKGARTFAAYARAMVDDLGDAVKPYLQSWYMAVRADPRAAGFKADMDKASAVEDVDVDKVLADSVPAAAPAQEQNAPTEAKDGNATRPVDRPGQRALEGTPADPVQAPDASGNAGPVAEGSRSADGGRPGSAEGASGPAGSVGDGARALPVPPGGAGRKPRGEPKPRAGRNARRDADPGLFGDGTGPDPQELTAPNVAPPAPPAFTPTDFEIADDLALGEGGQKAKYRGNVEAIRLLRDLEATGRTATQAEQRVLARYVGWGGIAQAFDGSNKDWAREYAELKELLTPEEWATANESTQYAHYTSREIIGGIYDALARMGFTGGKILEPGSGVGNFVGLMPAGLRTASRFTGVEREAIAVGIAKQLYPLQNIQRADFTEFIGNDGYFDLAIGNPPFARNPLTDKSGRKHLTGLSVHNYFFAKAVDMLREGGILAQVVSNSFMDAKRDTARKYIADRTEFLGAIRLPNNAFAKNANTEVTTDIVFLKKLPESEWGSRGGKENRDRWLDVAGILDPEGGPDILINRYFQENPEMMLGRMGRFGTMYGPGQPALVAKPGQDTAALLKAAIARLPQGVYTSAAVGNTAAVTDAAIVALSNPKVQEGGHYVEGDKLYRRLQDIAGEARAVELTPATMWTEKTRLGDEGYARIKGLAGLRQTLRGLLAAELADSKDIEQLRKRLNEEYDAYAKKHGLINDRPSARVFDDDPDYPLLASLEHGFTPGISALAAKKMGVKPMPATAKKGPIFNARVIERRTAPSRAASPADALNISMAERGRIDAGYIGSLLGRDGEEALREMSAGDKPLLFMDPASNEYVLRDAYLSGNVRAKLAQARQAGMMNNARALEAVQPPDVSAGEISVRVGSPWVPAGIYEEFARHLFGDGTKAKFTYVKANSSYMATLSAGSDVADSTTWGTNNYPGTQILTSLMNNREIKVMYLDENKSLKVDKEATDAANQKATEVKQAFSDWAFADPERADVLAKAYNEANNNYVTRAFDGAYMQFPGKVPDSIIKFRRHQRNAIARIVQDRTSLLDHVVGAGKTFTVISAAMELKRTGLAKKPLIMVPNHLVKQWASDFYRLYPGANILTATKKDFEKANRRRFLAKIATGNWDAVIMAHSSFGFIKPAPEFEAMFNEKQVANVMATIAAVENGDGDEGAKKRTVKQLAALKERLENRIDALRQKPIDALLDFKEIGVDQLFVDEAHLFKNLMFTTKMQNVRGLGDSAGSQRAYDLFIKANQLFAQNGRGQGVVFATGTPVSNSLAEMYHMMRYLMPQALQDGGFESFDAWANTFASVEQVWMQKISANGFKADNRMSNFVNTHELLKMFDQVADTVTMEDIKRAYSEENDGAEFPLPKLKTGRRQPVSLVKSAAQEAYMADIASRAAAIEGKRTNEKGKDNALKIMGDARKAAMDIRLVDVDRTERDKGGRIDRAADEIDARYRQYNSVKGTQLVFSDLGTPIKHAKAEMKEWEALQARIQKAVDPEIVTAANLGNEAAMKAVEDAEDAQREMDEKGADWLDAVKAALRGFSVYDDLRAALVERGVPDSEIAFIHDYNTDEQKLSLFRKVNAGDIRVLIGSTPKLGAGTNVQDRLVALHHLDVPWKPSDVEQREGRIIRQGNKLMDMLPGFEVEILAYVTQDTLDMRMWQVQETKLKMINQLRTRQIGREIDNAFEDMEMSAGEMQAAATGNMDLLKEIQLRTDVKKLEQAKRSHDAQRNDLASRKKRAEEAVSALPAKIAKAEKMAEASMAYTGEQKAQVSAFKVEINGKTYTDPREAGAVLQTFVDAKQYKKKGADDVLTPEQYQALPEDERSVDNGWQERPVPLKVSMDGKEYTARAALGEAFADVRGDANDPPMLKVDGQTYIRRTKAAAAIAQRVADSIADSKAVDLGKIGPFTVTMEGQGENKYYEGSVAVEVVIRAPGGVEASTTLTVKGIASEDDARKAATSVINAAMSLASGGEMQARWLREDLERTKKVLADLATAKAMGEFPQQAKLDEARAAHREVLVRLAAKPEAAADGDSAEGDEPALSRSAPRVATGLTPEGFPEFAGQRVTLAFPQESERFEIIPEPGQKVVSYAIMPAEGFDVLGHVELLMEGGRPVSLLDIEVYRDKGRGTGIGRATIETLLAANPDADLNISNIVPAARGFWERMGIPQQNVEGAYDGNLNWQTYAENNPAAQGDAAASRAARSQRDTGRQGEGAGAAGQGQEVGLRRGAAGGMPLDVAQRLASEMKAAGAPKIEVVQSVEDLPERYRDEVLAKAPDGRVRGVYFRGSDRVFLIADNIRGSGEFVFVALHESFHRGLAKTVPGSLALLRQLRIQNQALRAATAEQMKRHKIGVDEAIEEALADMAGDGRIRELKGIERLFAAIREWVRKIGRALGLNMPTLSDEQLLAFIRSTTRAGLTGGVHVEAGEAGNATSDDASLSRAGDAIDTAKSALTARGIAQRFDDLTRTSAAFNWWHRTVGTQYHKANAKDATGALRNPGFKAVYDEAQEYLHDTSAFANDPADLAPDLLPQLKKLKDIMRPLALKPADQQALAQAVFGGTLTYVRDDSGQVREAREDETPGVVFTPAELREMFNFTDAQVKQYQQFRAATNRSLDILVATDVARLLGEGMPEPLRAMIQQGDTGRFRGLVTAFTQQMMAKADADLAAVRKRHRNEMAAFWRKQKGLMEGPRGRAGARLALLEELDAEKNALKFKQGGEKYRAEQEAKKWADIEQSVRGKYERIDELKARGYAPLTRFGRYTVDVVGADGARQFFSMYETEREANAAARQFREAAEPGDSVTQGIMSEEAYKQFSGLTPETIELFAEVAGVEKTALFEEYLRRAKNNRSALKRLISRKGTAGYSEDASRVLASFITSNARASSAAMHIGRMAQAVEDIPKEQGDVKDEASKLKEYVQNPQEEAQGIRSLLFAQYLGGSVASAMVNMTQPFMMTFPYLSQFGGPAKAGARLAAAMKQAMGTVDEKTPLGKALRLAEKEGIVEPQELHQLRAEASRIVSNNQYVRRGLFVWGSLFALAERFNRRVSFIAAWNTATAQGMDDPFKFAVQSVEETQGVYNKGNRPNWARGAIGATLFTFKQYSISYVEFLKRLPTRERALALAILVLAAGAQGVPGSDDLDDIIDTIGQHAGYDTNAKAWKLDVLQNALGEAGADFVLRGASSLPGFPLDVAGRLSLGNMIPGTGFLRKDKTDKAGEVAEAGGPAVSAIAGMVNALPALAQGDGSKLIELAGPTSLKNLGKAIQMWMTGEYRDQAGRKVTEVSAGDAIVKGIGFQPAHVARDTRNASLVQQRIALARTVESEIASEWAQGIADKEPERVAAAIARRDKWNAENPASRININRAQLVKRVREMKSTRDERIIKRAPKEMRQGVAETLAS